jgi:hypothetical protein
MNFQKLMTKTVNEREMENSWSKRDGAKLNQNAQKFIHSGMTEVPKQL